MPLPAALLAKLKNRGIVAPKEQKPKEDEEEVFAEDYDESDKSGSSDSSDEDDDDDSENSMSEDEEELNEKNTTRGSESKRDSLEKKELIKRSDCPNSNNPYHECSSYCKKKYGAKKFEPDPIMERRRLRMLKVYPLLPNWCEVPDLKTNRYYYWNIETDQVCWLSPSHPKAKFENHIPQEPVVHVNTKFQYEYPDHHVSEPKIPAPEPPRETTKQSYHYKKKSHQSSAVDPMDPSSYSDVKRGKWSAGMDSQPSVKIGSSVDEN